MRPQLIPSHPMRFHLIKSSFTYAQSKTFLPSLAHFTLALLTIGMMNTNPAQAEETTSNERQTATFGGGCFWCTEAVFDATEGVFWAKSGYAGGKTLNPTYEAICTGTTGHAEVIQIEFDPSVISYADVLQIFFRTHNPTTLNRQGADAGTQYRSVVYYHDDAQKETVEEIVKSLDASGAFDAPIVTEISPLPTFYEAEAYHQGYFAKNPTQGYCRAVIAPKMDKYRKAFADRLKTNATE